MSAIGRGSTQDVVTGTPVSIIANEAGDGSLIQAVTGVTRKSDASWTHRGPLSAADAVADLSAAGFGSSGLIDLGNAPWLDVAATCDTPSKSAACRVVWYDGSGVPRNLGDLLTFASDPTLRVSASGAYIASASSPGLIPPDAGTARYAKVYVASVSGGSWDFYARPA